MCRLVSKLICLPEQIGVEIVDDLDMQRESLIRTRDRVSSYLNY